MTKIIKKNTSSTFLDISLSRLCVLIIIFALFGNGFVAVGGDFFHLNTNRWNELLKLPVVILSTICIIIYFLKSNKINRRAFWIAIIFLAIFGISGIRIILSDDVLHHNNYYYLGFIAFIFFPCIAIIINYKNLPNIENLLTISVGFITIGAFLLGDTSSFNSETSGLVDTGRLHLNTFNPMSVGLMSGLFIIMLSWKYRKKSLPFPLFFFFFLVGLVVLLQANSRGPIIFTFLVLILLFNFRFFFVLLFFSPLIFILTHDYFIRAASRALNIGDPSNAGRIGIYDMYINAAIDNLFFPNIALDYSLLWSHNIILGIYGSSSLFGVFIFLILFRSAILNYKFLNIKNSSFAWINYVFVFILLVSFFSGSLLDFYFWITFSLLLAYGIKEKYILCNRDLAS